MRSRQQFFLILPSVIVDKAALNDDLAFVVGKFPYFQGDLFVVFVHDICFYLGTLVNDSILYVFYEEIVSHFKRSLFVKKKRNHAPVYEV